MTSSKLAEKHPSTPNDLKLPAEPSPADKDTCFTVSREEVKKCLNRFNSGSGGGHDCLLPQHLKDLSSESLGKVANDLLDALCRFFNEIVLPGNVPANVCPAFFGAKMFGLSKKDGGIRPIAVGCSLRRIAAKLCMHKVKDECKIKFLPHQLGVGVTSGAESSIHVCRKYVKYNHSTSKVLLKVDFKNAFNLLRRDGMLQLVKTNFPRLFPMVWQCYSSGSHLYFGSDIIISATGIQQGDPLGGFLFSLGINDMIAKRN